MHGAKFKAKCAGVFATAGRGGHEQTADEISRYLRRIPEIQLFKLMGACGRPDTDPSEQTELIAQAKDIGIKMADILTAE